MIRKLEPRELTPAKLNELARFLHDNLDRFGDDLASIEKCCEYLAAPDKGGTVVVAESGEEIAGATVLLKTHMSGFLPENFLVYIAVSAKFRGQGLGKKILDKAKEEIDGGIALHVEPDNPAKRLYEREGFTNKYLEMRYIP